MWWLADAEYHNAQHDIRDKHREINVTDIPRIEAPQPPTGSPEDVHPATQEAVGSWSNADSHDKKTTENDHEPKEVSPASPGVITNRVSSHDGREPLVFHHESSRQKLHRQHRR